MNLHEHREDFEQLIAVTANYIGIPQTAVRRDYYIVKLLQNLQNSNYANSCVFKGGTSLSKCYPGSINRFSEDIDLTFVSPEAMSNKQYDKTLKRVESAIVTGFNWEKINAERNARNKSSYVWSQNEERDSCKVKIEIGSSVIPEPFSMKEVKTYIQEYLDASGMHQASSEFELEPVTVNTLDITRTFLDKVLAVKRHAICGTLMNKVRHIYDVTMLINRDDIQAFLSDADNLKELLQLTKANDSFYLQKRNISKDFNPLSAYCFEDWSQYFNDDIKKRYETLHKDLLYTDKRQNFSEAKAAFEQISNIFAQIDE